MRCDTCVCLCVQRCLESHVTEGQSAARQETDVCGLRSASDVVMMYAPRGAERDRKR